eukprot:gene6660-7412_t
MGTVHSAFTEEELIEYQELTYLNQREILQCYSMFVNLDESRASEGRTIRHPMTTMFKLPELQANPFRDRICRVFSSQNDGSISFDDYLDFMSTFSESAPKKVKIEYAFRIYDFNGDDYICKKDLAIMIRRLSGRQRFSQRALKNIVKMVMHEADLDDDEMLSFAEFEHILYKCPEFMRTFRIKI